MKKTFLPIALVLALTASTSLQSCLGSFALTKKVMTWNRTIGNKYVNEIVFFAFWVVPVYEICGLADLFVINSIEFWSGENPVDQTTAYIDGRDARYRIDADATGYLVTNLSDNTSFRFNFDKAQQAWSIEKDGQEHFLFSYLDDTHINVIAPGGTTQTVELSAAGTLAYRQLLADELYAAR